MNIPLTKIFLILMFVFVLFSNVLEYVAIATIEWLRQPVIVPAAAGSLTTAAPRRLWDLDITSFALIATGVALNILSLLFAGLSVASLCVNKIRDRFAAFFVFACLVTSLVALVFNSTGWYMIVVNLQKEVAAYDQNRFSKFSFGWSYWLMTPSFACSVLAAVFAACIIGCSFALNKFEHRQRRSQVQVPAPGQTYQITTTKNPSFSADAGFYSTEPRPSGILTTTYSYQNESYQNEQKVLRL